MSIFDYKESIITQRRAGNDTDPFVPIVRNIMIKNGLVQLPEIPSEFQKVKVTGNNENWFEIVNGTPIGNQYKVSYLHGYVEFDPIHDGKILTFEFMGTGNTYISVERIWLSFDGEKVTKTLGDLISSGESALEGLERLDEKIQETNQAINNANIAADNANQATNRVDDAINRANQISDTVSQEEQVRITNEVTRQTNESERVINEDTRKANEQDRINAEIERSNNEVDRIDEENIRIINEQARESSEALRVQREQDRVNEENIRISNEQNRVFAESERVSNEDIREQNEQTRISNENIRQTNEQDRINRYNNFVYLGEYDNTITYQPYNIISWQGSSYMCVQPSIGNLPLDNNYWKLLSRKGDKGATLTPKGVYNNTTLYEVNDLVTYDLGVYYCIQQSVGNDPTNTDYWALFLAGGGDMQREIYDTNFDGIVDNAERLGGQPPSYFAKQSDLETVQGSINNINNDISIINTNISTIDQNISTLQTDTTQLRTDVDNNTNQINTLSDRVTTIENELSDQQELTTTLKYGSQVIEVPRDTPFNVLSLKGRTLVNLLGKDGNCEDTSKWITSGSPTVSLDTANAKYGSNAIKITLSGTFAEIYQNVKNKLDSTKYYIALADVKNGNAIGIKLLFNFAGDAGIKYGNTVTVTNYQSSYCKFSGSDFDTATVVNLIIQVNGSSGQYAYVDGIRLYEIDQVTYNKIDVDPEYTGDKLAEKFPYVDSVQAIQNPYVIRRGKNLAKGYPYPYMDGNGTSSYDNVWANGKLAVRNGASSVHGRGLEIKVIPNMQYTLSFNSQKSALGTHLGRIAIGYTGTTSELLLVTVNEGFNTFTFTPIQDTVFIKFLKAGDTDQNNPVYFWDIQLELGNTATEYEPYQEDYLFLETKLHSSVDGTVYDELLPTDNGFEKFTRFKEVVLDGSLEWQFDSDFSGFKRVTLPNNLVPIATYANQYVAKYDGKLLVFNGNVNAIDNHFLNASGVLYVTISDTDSGWGETYTPTTQEIRAYFYGWKMNNGTFGTPYNGSGTKTWVPWSATSNANAVTTVPTTPSSDITNKVFDYYKLVYQLASSVRETVRYEGAISLKEGRNIIELGSGVIVRESVLVNNPFADGYGHINNTDASSTLLRYRTERILEIYRNIQKDNRWIKATTTAYGKERAYCRPSDYDPAASYSTTYLVLDKHLFTINPIDLSGSYEANLNEVVGKTVEKQANLETKVSVIENTYAKKEQMPWIRPTLLNGWVNFGGGYPPAEYYKDDLGVVHIRGLIKGGVTAPNTVIFTLPVGYRPSVEVTSVTVSGNGTSDIFSWIAVTPDGNVVFKLGGNTSFRLDGLSFRVWQ